MAATGHGTPVKFLCHQSCRLVELINKLIPAPPVDCRRLMNENSLDAGTLSAQKEEMERKRRVLELREKFQQQREKMQPRLSELQTLLDGETNLRQTNLRQTNLLQTLLDGETNLLQTLLDGETNLRQTN